MLKIAICIEQEELQTQYINYLEDMKKEEHITAEIEVFADSKQLLFEWDGTESYADIIFLGTTKIDELQVAKELRERGVDTSIVLLLKDSTKAVVAFDVKALRCIAINDMTWAEQGNIIKAALHRCEEQIYQQIVFKNRDEICKLSVKDIHYFEVFNHTIIVHYQRRHEQPSEFIFIGSIGKLANILGAHEFLYPNRTYLVAKSYVHQLIKGKLILKNEMKINISRLRLNEIREEMETIK